MSASDPRIDAYIEKARPFARPILRHIRAQVHEAAREAGVHVEERVKWGMPSFEYRGILCGMAAFKGHCALGFWKEALLFGGAAGEADPPAGPAPDAALRSEAMGQFGRITCLEDLPSDAVIRGFVREAIRLNEEGVKPPRGSGPGKGDREDAPLHEDFRRALEARPDVQKAYEAMAPGRRREYAEWIAEAKRDPTREKRIATALEWIAEGKGKNWKYERK
jgi:uncharacterized protein YdeI (YjbR/CyaY-like superfamily)